MLPLLPLRRLGFFADAPSPTAPRGREDIQRWSSVDNLLPPVRQLERELASSELAGHRRGLPPCAVEHREGWPASNAPGGKDRRRAARDETTRSAALPRARTASRCALRPRAHVPLVAAPKDSAPREPRGSPRRRGQGTHEHETMSDEYEIFETDVAIVGMSLRVPGARRQGAVLGEPARWGGVRPRARGRGAARSGRARRDCCTAENYVKASAPLEGMELFDGEFFGFSPKESAIMDPQHRHFLECCWEALENAGPHARALRRAHRRLRRLRDGQLLLLQPLLEPGAGARRGDVPPAPHRQRQGLPRVARVLSARSARPRRQHPDGLLDVAGRRPSGVPEPALTRVRHGARGRRDHRAAPPARLPLSRRARSCRRPGTATRSITARRGRCSAPAPAWWRSAG